MKHLLFLLIGVGFSPVASAQVSEYVLDAKKPITIGVSAEHSTTILFPKPVSAIIGSDLTNGGDGNDSAGFQYSHPTNSRVVAVVARSTDRNAPMVALLDEQLYLIHLRHSTTPQLAVTLSLPRNAEPQQAVARKPGEKKTDIPARLDFSRPNLLRLLKLTKADRLPTSSIPTHAVRFDLKQGQLTTRVDRITYFDADGAIGISGRITNHSMIHPVHLRPSQFQVRVGTQLFPVTISQVPLKIGRRKSVPFSTILMGNGKHRIRFKHGQPVYLVIPSTK